MRVELIKESNLRLKAEELTGDKTAFDDFIYTIREVDWETPKDITQTIAKSDVISDRRVVFNLKGNHFRLICEYKFITDIPNKWVALYVCFVGTHEEYDELCDPANENDGKHTQYTIRQF